jgi:hypothetical protein
MQKQEPQRVFSQSQEEAIRQIVTSELLKLKKQIDIEISADIANLEKKLTAVEKSVETTTANVRKDIAKNQLAIVTKSDERNRELILAVGQQITNTTYKKVMEEINREIVPKINNMASFVAYQMQDPTEIITDYRRAVHNQSEASTAGRITDGNDRHVISEHVQVFFRDEE